MSYKVLDLFSGIGGFSLGLEWAGMETVAFVENNEFCRNILQKHWPAIPCAGDIKNLEYKNNELLFEGVPIYGGAINVICGGYPCQPFSVAGNRKGEEDARHLWPEMFKLIQAAKPQWVIAENVAGHIQLGADAVISQMESIGYSVWAFVIPACAVGAHHRRDRLWIVAHSDNGAAAPFREYCEEEVESWMQARDVVNTDGNGCGGYSISQKEEPFRRAEAAALPNGKNDANSHSHDVQGREQFDKEDGQEQALRSAGLCDRARQLGSWEAEPNVGRVAYGISSRVDRLKALGNAVVPELVFIIATAILRYQEWQKFSSSKSTTK